MSFVAALALFVGVLVVAPYLAHRLRRKRADDRPFAAAHLVPPAPPRARRRSRLEDRALFASRALAVLALALLGASPLVRCSRLALQRSSGASVALAIVLDDSMSMRARLDGGKTRFERALDGARELLASAREGDAVAIVAAGEPARVALAATTDLRAAQAALDGLAESDRATDLDGAVAMARALVGQLPQVDKRVVVLSDLADGHSDKAPLGEGSEMPVWVALPELRASGADCALLSADRAGLRVRVRVACSQGANAQGREITLTAGDTDTVVAKGAAPQNAPADAVVMLSAEPAGELTAHLSGTDAIASDDVATVMTESGPGALAVIGDTAAESAATGGAPLIEQALAALKLEIGVRPIPVFPERAEDLAPFVGVVLDDPPGLTPEQRRALGDFMENGGVVLLALGPRAAVAPLGASLEPVLSHAVRWELTKVPGADPASAREGLEEAATSLLELDASHRSILDAEDVSRLNPLLAWKDGPPLVAAHTMGRGEAWIVTLPFSVDSSDLTLRPGFLSVLDAWVGRARMHASARRGEVAVPWLFPGVRRLAVVGPKGPIEPQREGATWRVSPPLIGKYRVEFDDGKREVRVATPSARELDLRPRAAAPNTAGRDFGDTRAAVDVSWVVALILLFLTACELGLRVFSSTVRPIEP